MNAGRATLVIVGEMLEALRARFTDAEQPPLAGRVPAGRVQHRGGAQVALDGFGGDDGCDALVWINLLRTWRTNEFPVESQSPVECTATRAALFQVGVARCVSTVDDQGWLPSADVLDQEALALLDDAHRLDRAVCQAARRLVHDREVALAYSLGPGEPIGPEGGLVTWVQTVTFQIG